MTTNVYLDVDGVILPFTQIVSGMRWGWPDWVDYNHGQAYSPQMVAALNRIADLPGVRMHWLTTWGRRAPEELCPLIGLHGERWPVVGERHHVDGVRRWWKLRALAEHRPGEQALWLDDDITDDQDALEWLHDHREVRWLSPDPWSGLHQTHLRIARDWAGRNAL